VFVRPREAQASRPIGDANASDYHLSVATAHCGSIVSRQSTVVANERLFMTVDVNSSDVLKVGS